MTKPCRALLLALSLATTLPLAGAEPSVAQPSRLEEQTLAHQGRAREFLVYKPRGWARLEGKRPLVLLLHGGGGTHRGMIEATQERFHELADRDGFFVAYPNAVDKIWDFGKGKISEELKTRIDDLGFFSKLIARLQATLPVDDERIFAAGISRGGQASYFLACKFPGVFRAIAPVAMPLPRFLEKECRTGPPVGLALLNGTQDPIVPFAGGQITLFRRQRGEVLSTAETLQRWGERNGCEAESQEVELLDHSDDGTRVEKRSWSKCSGAPVVLYTIFDGGHTWPSGSERLPSALVGKTTRDIDGAEEIWSFFSQFE